VIRSDRAFSFDVPVDQLWSAIVRTEDYPTWWPWLRSFAAEGFETGAAWRCLVQPPLPYSLRFTITLDDVVPCEHAVATITGDIEGTATLTVEPDGEGSRARLVSDLAPASGLLQAFALAARPLVVWGHDRVLDRGASQFSRRGLS
jgi:uncharacterized protein YndB with AHSA1/START domain